MLSGHGRVRFSCFPARKSPVRNRSTSAIAMNAEMAGDLYGRNGVASDKWLPSEAGHGEQRTRARSRFRSDHGWRTDGVKRSRAVLQ